MNPYTGSKIAEKFKMAAIIDQNHLTIITIKTFSNDDILQLLCPNACLSTDRFCMSLKGYCLAAIINGSPMKTSVWA